MKDIQALVERMPQWQDGLLSDVEILGYALNGLAGVYTVLHTIRESLEKKEKDNYWYRLEHAQADKWVSIPHAPIVGMTKEQARKTNLCLGSYRFHSEIADLPPIPMEG